MKARELAYLLGWRPAARTYGFDVRSFDLPSEGRVEYAQWLHPGETRKEIRQDVVDALRTVLRPGDVAIDVGAHTGDSTIPMALAVGASGRVLALEPNPYVFRVLEKNAALNPAKTHIVALNFAATAEPGPCEFEYSDAGFCNGGRHERISRWRHGHAFKLTVRGENLQAYIASQFPALTGRIRYIKVDAEGYDLAVLRSLDALIDRERPFIRAEVYKFTSREQRQELFAFLDAKRYEIRRIESEVHLRGERLAGADVMRWPHFDIFCTPG